MHSRARFPLSCSGEKLSCHPSTPSQCSSTMKIFDRPQMSLLSRGVMAQKNNDSDQQTEIAVRQLQPPHTQAGSQTPGTQHLATRRSTRLFFAGKLLGNSGRARESLGGGRGGYLPGLERGAREGDGESGCPGSHLHPSVGADKAMASPSRTGAASPAVRCGDKDLTSLLPSCHRAQETLLGCQAGSPRQGSVRAPPLSPAFLLPSEDGVAVLRQMCAQPQHPCPAASSPPPPRRARGAREAQPTAHRCPAPLTLSPLLFLLPFLLHGCSSRPLQLTEVPGAEQPLFPPGRGKSRERISGQPGAERGERSAAAAGHRTRHRCQMPRNGKLSDAAARHGSLKGLRRT